MLKKLWILLLALTMIILSFPLGVYAEEPAEEPAGEDAEQVDADHKQAYPWNSVMLTFDANGGYFYDDEELTYVSFIRGKDDTFHYNVDDVQNKNGKLFSGWSLVRDDASARVDVDWDSFEEDTTLYALYESPVTITFHSNGIGEFSGGETEVSRTVPRNTEFEEFNTIRLPVTTEKYVCKEWNTKPDGTGASFGFIDSWGSPSSIKGFVPTEDTDLYMIWAEAAAVTYVNNYESEIVGEGARKLIRIDKPRTRTHLIAKGEKVSEEYPTESYNGAMYEFYDFPYAKEYTVGYDNVPSDVDLSTWQIFAGWSTAEDDPSTIIQDIENFIVTEDITLYSTLVPASQTNRIVLHGNGVDFKYDDATIPTLYAAVYPGKKMIVSHSFADGTGKQFLGWNTQPDGSGQFIHKDGDSVLKEYSDYYTPTGPMDLYAIWKDTGNYVFSNITIDANGGSLRIYEDFGTKDGHHGMEWINSETYKVFISYSDIEGIKSDFTIEDIASIASKEGFVFDGLTTAKDDPTTKITNDYFPKNPDTLYILWKKAPVNVQSVSLNKDNLNMLIGDSETLAVTVLPEDADDKSVTWSSSDANVAVVDENGKVTAHKSGSAVITVKTNDGGYTAECKVTVTKKDETVHVSSVSLNKEELTLRVGKSETLIATVLPEDAEDKSVTWSSSDPSVAKVDANGKVTAVADTGIADPASAVITVTTNDGSYTASCTVTVEDPVNAFVRRLYDLCFGRKADSGGFNMWTSGLRTKKYTAAFVVQAFFTSNEMKNMKLPNEEWVERCYLVMMNR
ncbi:MAG: Ig-like domain-containing protein, partial [Solobacterium sp.]|nr:Ig-like domain-containing protein [Solobacterium sp.]